MQYLSCILWLVLTLLLPLQPAQAQSSAAKFRVGVAAGVQRQFMHSFRYAANSDHESTQAKDGFGGTARLYLLRLLTPERSLYLSPRFSTHSTEVQLRQSIPDYAEVRHLWASTQYTYSLAMGLNQRLLARGTKQFYARAGLVGNLEYRNTHYSSVHLSFSSNRYNSIYTSLDYDAAPSPKFTVGAEAGLGLRLYDGVDLVLGYTHNLTPSKVLHYTAELGSRAGAADVRATQGTYTFRGSYLSAEVLFWLNQ